MSIRHRIENELSELGEEHALPTTAELAAWVEALVPQDRALTPALTADPLAPHKAFRLSAAGKLKAFQATVARKAEGIGTPLLITYLEQKAGLSQELRVLDRDPSETRCALPMQSGRIAAPSAHAT